LILVVEDERSFHGFLRASLPRDECLFVETVKDALRAVAGRDFELIVLDVVLPDGKGTEVLRWLRMARKETPVLAISGAATFEDAEPLVNYGVDAILAKPFHGADLMRVATRLLKADVSHRSGTDSPRAYWSWATVQEAARDLGISRSTLDRQVGKRARATPRALLAGARLDKVQWLLANQVLSLAEVAAMGGFCDASYLSRWFKRMTGLRPSEYRMSERMARLPLDMGGPTRGSVCFQVETKEPRAASSRPRARRKGANKHTN
jgi:two-component system, OmpR family, response regulator QseB